jgi:hypothetical protein
VKDALRLDASFVVLAAGFGLWSGLRPIVVEAPED